MSTKAVLSPAEILIVKKIKDNAKSLVKVPELKHRGNLCPDDKRSEARFT